MHGAAVSWLVRIVIVATCAAVSVAGWSSAVAQAPATVGACWELIEPAEFADTAELSSDALAAIDCVAHYGITRGTTATTYSPTAPVDRSQMARFLVRTAAALEMTLPDGSSAPFDDLEDLDADGRRSIARLHQLGITKGRGSRRFSPSEIVPRWQMALFVDRLLDAAEVELPDASAEDFEDLDEMSQESLDAIGRLAAAGIMAATTSKRFDPEAQVTRESMSLILARVLQAADARPARLRISLSSDNRPVGGAVEGTVSALKPNGAPYRGLLVDLFAAFRLTPGGACALDAGARINGADAGTSQNCVIDRGDPRTDVNGEIKFGLAHSEQPANNRVYAWAGPAGQVFDADDVRTEAVTTIAWVPIPSGVFINAPENGVFGGTIAVTARLTGPAAANKRMVLIAGDEGATARKLVDTVDSLRRIGDVHAGGHGRSQRGNPLRRQSDRAAARVLGSQRQQRPRRSGRTLRSRAGHMEAVLRHALAHEPNTTPHDKTRQEHIMGDENR